MFVQKRSGSFACVIAPNSPHCGPDSQPMKTFRYSVTCVTTDDALDSNGFILDNLFISSYFENKYGPTNPVSISCEKMAMASAKELFELMPKHSSCRSLEVEIEAFPGATITYQWLHPAGLHHVAHEAAKLPSLYVNVDGNEHTVYSKGAAA